jgi:hypothetical protein
MKRPATIKDHLRYYRTYGGFKARRKAAPVAQPEPEKPAPFVVKPRDKQSARLSEIEKRLAAIDAARNAETKPAEGLVRAQRQLKTLESRVNALETQPKPTPATPEDARERARSARSIRALELRVKELESRPTTSPGLDLAKARLAKAEARRASKLKESNAKSVPSGTNDRVPRA